MRAGFGGAGDLFWREHAALERTHGRAIDHEEAE